jgi:hypothetical protein
VFYKFSLERHVPESTCCERMIGLSNLDGLRRELGPFYSTIGQPSIDPELMIRMLIVANPVFLDAHFFLASAYPRETPASERCARPGGMK